MPNHVTTRCTVVGVESDLLAFKERCVGPKNDGDAEVTLDFQRILPMPTILEGTQSGSYADHGLILLDLDLYQKTNNMTFPYGWMHKAGIETPDDLRRYIQKTNPESLSEILDLGQKSLDAYRATGFLNWYDWSVRNWGVKWNSYSFSMEHESPTCLEFTFATAWDFPVPVFVALGEMFPDLTFTCTSYDEGGNFALRAEVENGELSIVELDPEDDSVYEEVYGFAPEKWEEDEEEERDYAIQLSLPLGEG